MQAQNWTFIFFDFDAVLAYERPGGQKGIAMSELVEKQTTPKRRVGRSPAYPFINVQKALEKTQALYAQEGEYEAPLSSATAAWGYSSKSSGARQTLATLKYYGLIDVSGDGDVRKVKVTDTARRIMLDQREDQTEKRQLIRKVALNPAAHKVIYEKYGSGLASDGSVVHFLVFDVGFNKDAATELLAEFKETARFANLYELDKKKDKNVAEIDGAEGGLPMAEVKAGDKVQWTSQGTDQFPSGAVVLGLSEDGKWVFTDQGSSGVPIGEVSILEAHSPTTPPSIPAHLAALARKSDQNSGHEFDVRPGSRKAVFPVEDGDVTLIFPEDISADGLEELGQYLNIFLKKEQKRKNRET